MITRPSYAQLTLELARASLQSIPVSAGGHTTHRSTRCRACTAARPTARHDGPLATRREIQRWRRKSATTQ